MKQFVAKILVAACLHLGSVTALATEGGSTVGNGGDVVVCRGRLSRGVPRVEMLDYFEARIHDRRSFPYGRRYQTPQDRIDEILNNVVRHDPVRVARYRDFANYFLSESDIEWSDSPLMDVPDSGHELAPPNCRVRQLIIRRSQSIGSRKTFLVDRGLWRQMDSIQRAAAVLHEAMLEEMLARHSSARDSRPARYLNGLWGSEQMSGLLARDYARELNETPPFFGIESPFQERRGREPLEPILFNAYSFDALGVPRIFARFMQGKILIPGMNGAYLLGDWLVPLEAGSLSRVDWSKIIPRLLVPADPVFAAGVADSNHFRPLEVRAEVRLNPGTPWVRLRTHSLRASANSDSLSFVPHEEGPLPNTLPMGRYEFQLIFSLRDVFRYHHVYLAVFGQRTWVNPGDSIQRFQSPTPLPLFPSPWGRRREPQLNFLRADCFPGYYEGSDYILRGVLYKNPGEIIVESSGFVLVEGPDRGRVGPDCRS